MAKPGGDNESTGGTPFSGLVDDIGDGRRRRRNHHKFGREGQLGRDWATAAKPSISAWRGLTRPNSPAKFALRILPRMARPTDPCRELPPTSATECGDSRFFKR